MEVEEELEMLSAMYPDGDLQITQKVRRPRRPYREVILLARLAPHKNASEYDLYLLQDTCRELSVHLTPRTGGQSSHDFVMAQIVMTLEVR